MLEEGEAGQRPAGQTRPSSQDEGGTQALELSPAGGLCFLPPKVTSVLPRPNDFQRAWGKGSEQSPGAEPFALGRGLCGHSHGGQEEQRQQEMAQQVRRTERLCSEPGAPWVSPALPLPCKLNMGS